MYVCIYESITLLKYYIDIYGLLFRRLRVSESTVLAVFHNPGTSCERNVLEGMTQSASSSVANGHFSLHFNGWNLVHEIQSIASVFAELVHGRLIGMIFATFFFDRAIVLGNILRRSR